MFWRYIAILSFVSIACAGCTRMYSLPDPPPKDEWVKAQKPQESPEEAMKRYIDAKRSAIQCFAALADEKWSQALSWMTDDSVDFLRKHAIDGDLEASLAAHKLQQNGDIIPFDPVNDVFIAGLADIRDEFGDRTDDEDDSTKILYAIAKSGDARRIVVVLEDNRWKVKLTEIPNPLLTP